ncbi:MAG: hypothetical protein IIT65_07050 [Lachnospiraceae bacterium]|nr:hypothetical protein [Lachnospiraceae bacterium]
MNNNFVNNSSFLLQLYSVLLLLQDFNNTDLMNELQRQDNEYLEKIIEQNNEIINLLKERRKSDE